MLLGITLAIYVRTLSILAEERKELSPKTRPYVELSRFKRLTCVSVSQFRYRNGATNQLEIGRVYRFTYRANKANEWNRWAKEFPRNEGWRIEVTDDKTSKLYKRDLKNARVSTQAVFLHAGKIVRDPKAKGGARYVEDSDWVWVSFDEILTTKKW